MCERLEDRPRTVEYLEKLLRISYRARHSSAGYWYRQHVLELIVEIRALKFQALT